MSTRHLMERLQSMPPGSTVPVEWVCAQIAAEGVSTKGERESLEDLDVPAVAAVVKRAPSTVRGWLGGGLIPEAYRLQGRDWRVPRAALRRFLDRQTAEPTSKPAPRRRGADLGEWRKHIKEAG